MKFTIREKERKARNDTKNQKKQIIQKIQKKPNKTTTTTIIIAKIYYLSELIRVKVIINK